MHDLAVALDIDAAYVIEHAATLANQAQQTTAAVMVLAVGLEVLGEVIDACGLQRDLHLGRTRVGRARLVRRDNWRLIHCVLGHFYAFRPCGLSGGRQRHRRRHRTGGMAPVDPAILAARVPESANGHSWRD